MGIENGHNQHIDPFGEQTGLHVGIIKDNPDRAWHDPEWQTPTWFAQGAISEAAQQQEIASLVNVAKTIPLPKHHHGEEVCENSYLPPVAVWAEGPNIWGSCTADEDFLLGSGPELQLEWGNDE